MPVANQVISLEQAIAREHPTWDVFIEGFGRGVDVLYPVLTADSLPSVAAMAIGPRSQIDRCWVLMDPQVVVNPPAPAQADYLRRLARQAPLLFPQFGKKNQSPTPIGPNSSLRVVASPGTVNVGLADDWGSLLVPANFLASDQIAEQTFTFLDGVGNQDLRQPYLHLVFYLKPPTHAAPRERYPYQSDLLLSGLIGPSGSPLADDWIFQGALPIHGRRQINCNFYAPFTSDIVYDVRIGLVQFGANQELQGPKEVVLSTAVQNVSATNPVLFQQVNPGFDYLTIWAARQSGSDEFGRMTVTLQD